MKENPKHSAGPTEMQLTVGPVGPRGQNGRKK
jgi:hypothetical protein